MSSFTVTTDLTLIDLAVVHRWLSTDADAAPGRSKETVELAASRSLNFGAIDADGQLVGYARVVTDHATFAWLCDVSVPPDLRGHGLGLDLARTVVEALRPMGLKRVLLSTQDAHGLYKKVGFEDFPHPEKLMLLLDQGTSR